MEIGIRARRIGNVAHRQWEKGGNRRRRRRSRRMTMRKRTLFTYKDLGLKIEILIF